MSVQAGVNYSRYGMISTADYIILASSIAIPFAIAIWTAFKNKNTTQDFFTANKSMGAVPVAMSMLSTFTSGTMILVYSADVYGHGLEFSVCILGGLIGIPVFTYMNLKVFYDLKVGTVFEYLEMRYHSVTLRICLMLLEVMKRMINMGVALCGPCLVLSAVTPVDVEIYIIVLGILCAIYATIGGMRGVIWTDFFMMVVIVLGLFAVIVVGCLHLGPSEIWQIASQGGRTKLFNFNPSLYQRQNFYLLIVYGFLVQGKYYGIDQLSLQRALSLRSFSEYKKVLAILLTLYTVMYALIFASGVVAYATYAGCDPLTEGKIMKVDQILPYLISDKLDYVQGASGLFLAAIVCAGISSVSSYMNVLSNLIFSDLLSNIKFFQELSERTSLIMCKTMTLLMGVPGIALAIAVSKARSLMSIAIISFGVLNGPSLGVFFLALLFPMSKLLGVIIGFFVSFGILAWMAIGRVLYKSEDEFLPLSVEFCNSTSHNDTLISESVNIFSSVNQTIWDTHANDTSSSSTMYDVSYLFFSVFGPLICLFVGLCLSYLTGAQKVETVSKELISPFVRRFYYKKSKNKKEEQSGINAQA